MEKLITEIYAKKITDGTFEKIVAEQFEKMMTNVCNDMMSWNGEVRKALEIKIKPLLLECVERSDLSRYIVKLETIINTAIEESPLNSYKNVLDSLRAICGSAHEKISYGKDVKTSEIFKKYLGYVEHELRESDFDDSELDTDDGAPTANIDCYMTIENDTEGSFFDRRNSTLTLCNDKNKNDESVLSKTYLSLHLRPNDEYESSMRFCRMPVPTLRDLPYMSEFHIYLLDLYNAGARIIIDNSDMTEEVCIEFEE